MFTDKMQTRQTITDDDLSHWEALASSAPSSSRNGPAFYEVARAAVPALCQALREERSIAATAERAVETIATQRDDARDLLSFYRSCALSGEVPSVEPADVIAKARTARAALEK